MGAGGSGARSAPGGGGPLALLRPVAAPHPPPLADGPRPFGAASARARAASRASSRARRAAACVRGGARRTEWACCPVGAWRGAEGGTSPLSPWGGGEE